MSTLFSSSMVRVHSEWVYPFIWIQAIWEPWIPALCSLQFERLPFQFYPAVLMNLACNVYSSGCIFADKEAAWDELESILYGWEASTVGTLVEILVVFIISFGMSLSFCLGMDDLKVRIEESMKEAISFLGISL